MVCLGNICRSPTAEAALREALIEGGLADVEVDSAGTGTWHLGNPPDARMTAAAAEVGLRLQGTARRVSTEDFRRYDLILAMDAQNEADLLAMAPDAAGRAKVKRFREFDEAADDFDLDVPDPYFGEGDGFARVVTIARAAARGLAAHLALARGAPGR